MHLVVENHGEPLMPAFDADHGKAFLGRLRLIT